MPILRPVLSVLLALASSSLFMLPPAEGANIRRHLHCSTVGGTTLGPGGILSINIPGSVTVLNNWSSAVPAGTTYSIRIGNHTMSVQYAQALPSGAKFTTADADATGTGLNCDASFEDKSYGNPGKLTFNANLSKHVAQPSP